MATLLRECKGHSGAVNAIRFTKDGSYAMSCSDDRSVRLWNPHKSDPSKAADNEALVIKKYDGVHGYQILDVAIANVSQMPAFSFSRLHF
jgi:mitogen-activated protein kinase organizer 1